MTVQLYEGCWGVTRGGEVRGPIGWVSDDSGSYRWANPPYARGLWNNEGSYGFALIGSRLDKKDIIAVFATETEAGAYLAGEKPADAPKFPEVGSSFDYRRADGTWMKVKIVPDKPDTPAPVTWPDGVTKMVHCGTRISIFAGGVALAKFDGQYDAETALQLAALLKAAADYVKGGEK